jgi:hypothetical protein
MLGELFSEQTWLPGAISNLDMSASPPQGGMPFGFIGTAAIASDTRKVAVYVHGMQSVPSVVVAGMPRSPLVGVSATIVNNKGMPLTKHTIKSTDASK